MVLLELRKCEPDGVAVDRQLGRDALGERKFQPREEVAGDKLVLSGVRGPLSARGSKAVRSLSEAKKVAA